MFDKIKEAMADLKNARRGQAVMQQAMTIIFALFVIGVLLAAFVLAQTSFRDSITDADAQSVINNSIAAATSYSGLQTPVWIIAAIGLLIGILLATLGFFLLRRQ